MRGGVVNGSLQGAVPQVARTTSHVAELGKNQELDRTNVEFEFFQKQQLSFFFTKLEVPTLPR